MQLQGPDARTLVQTGAKVVPHLEKPTYGFTLGGPIWKDHLWFFIGYEKLERTGAPNSAGLPGVDAGDLALINARVAQISKVDYGTLDGTPLADVPAATWSEWRRDIGYVPCGDGESLASVGERVRAACADLTEEARVHDVVVVTHVSPIKAAAAWALGVGDEVVWRMYCAPASITEIGTAGAAPSLRSFNMTTHLGENL